MSICIFPGTFNPIHNAHLKMANFALEKYKFDKVIFVPAYIPPHKEINSNLAKHRFNMVKLATATNPRFEVSDFEYKNEGKSYSILTVKKFIEQYKNTNRLNFIIGTDAFAKIESWFNAEELKNLVHFIVFPRHGDENKEIFSELKEKNWDFEMAKMDYVDISSTEIRESLNESMLDEKVEDYIKDNGLYKY